jgi:hypothetical protein
MGNETRTDSGPELRGGAKWSWKFGSVERAVWLSFYWTGLDGGKGGGWLELS